MTSAARNFPTDDKRPKLAIVLSHPTQYYSPWFRWVAATTDIDLRIFYLWDFGVTAQLDSKFGATIRWDVDLLSGYEYEFVPNTSRQPGTEHFRGLNNPTISSRLLAWGPDAVLLFGYKWATHLRVIAWARRHRVPLIFRGDSHFLGRGSPPLFKRLLLSAVYAQFAAVLPVGVANRHYFSTLGVSSDRQFVAPHSVNDRLFDPQSEIHRRTAAEARSRLGIPPNSVVVLYAGKFVSEKQPTALLDAFLEIAPPGSHLLMVGDGMQKRALEQRLERSPAGYVHLLPFANQSEMPARYLMADVFVLPSNGCYETWGLAVNEAMHMGVPALVSDRVGCQQDLVSDGETGWVFPAGDNAALRSKLSLSIAQAGDRRRREELRSAVLARIAAYTYQQTTAGLLRALRSVVQPGHV